MELAEKRSFLKPLPGEPIPPEFESQQVDATMGRKIRAASVDDQEEEDSPPREERQKKTLSVENQEVLEAGRDIDEDLTAGALRSGPSRRERLSNTEMEKRISRYSKHLERLSPKEKRAVKEYYKHLRDLK